MNSGDANIKLSELESQLEKIQSEKVEVESQYEELRSAFTEERLKSEDGHSKYAEQMESLKEDFQKRFLIKENEIKNLTIGI